MEILGWWLIYIDPLWVLLTHLIHPGSDWELRSSRFGLLIHPFRDIGGFLDSLPGICWITSITLIQLHKYHASSQYISNRFHF